MTAPELSLEAKTGLLADIIAGLWVRKFPKNALLYTDFEDICSTLEFAEEKMLWATIKRRYNGGEEPNGVLRLARGPNEKTLKRAFDGLPHEYKVIEDFLDELKKKEEN